VIQSVQSRRSERNRHFCDRQDLSRMPKGSKVNRHCFREYVLPLLSGENGESCLKKVTLDVVIHGDNSKCNTVRQLTDKLASDTIQHASHAPYAFDRGPCDFWRFGSLTDEIKQQDQSRTQVSSEAIMVVWKAITFEELQSPFA
jgi:hypothetical protein